MATGKKRPWDAYDILLLAAMVIGDVPLPEMAERLGRTESAVSSKIYVCGLRQPTARWTPDDVRTLREAYAEGKTVSEICAMLPRHSRASIVSTAKSMGFSDVKSWDRWSDDEVETLKRLTERRASYDEMAAELPGRSVYQIRAKIYYLGLEGHPRLARWTEGDDARLRELVGSGATMDEVTADLGRTVAAVNARCTKLGIKHPPRAKRE
jgi:hypothetical protein